MSRKKLFGICIGVLLLFAAFAATACSSLPRAPLSGVTFGDVTIAGDENGFVADAVREAMYRRGASYDPSAPPLVGSVEWFELAREGQDAKRVRLHVRLDDKTQDLAALSEVYRKFAKSRTGMIRDAAAKVAYSMARQVVTRSNRAK